MAQTKKQKQTQTEISKPPVVVVMGHVDHGKTSLLDYIRKTRVAARESGGITQHIGAYQVESDGKKITFIDTPGHEAFSAMRARGVKVADVAVIVIAADDGVMPQTKEALKHAQDAGVPFIIAFNKVDKADADVTKVKTQLLEVGVTVEGFGGDTPNVEVSAVSGQGVDDLLEMITLVADLAELKADANAPCSAVVIESLMDSKRGSVATIIVNEGTLRVGDIIAAPSAWARVRVMEDFHGERLSDAKPGTPAIVLGFSAVPRVGDTFVIVANQKEAEAMVVPADHEVREATVVADDQRSVNIIVKADAQGTLEAVLDILEALQSEEVILRVLYSGTGEITDSDIRQAVDAGALLVGFRVRLSAIAKTVARNGNAHIVTFDTIYDLAEGVRKASAEHLEPMITEGVVGQLKILKIFRTEPSRMIVARRIMSGTIKGGASERVM
ncbi:MAG: translation initiation factor IF-2, partial [Candidatus Spechtbacterales bacterium]